MATAKQKAAKPSKQVVAYRFQRVFPGFITGPVLTVNGQRAKPVRPFMKQSDLDAACGIHLVAMIVAIFGLAKPSALHDMARRKYGVAAEIWTTYGHTYFTGVHALEWVQLFDDLELPIELTSKFEVEDNLDGQAANWLMAGELVAIAVASVKHSKTKHWTLGVGVEGAVLSDKSHVPDTLLLLDPSGSEPSFTTHNARLKLPTTGDGTRLPKCNLVGTDCKGKAKPVTWLYEAVEWPAEEIKLLAAVRVRLR
ncbi:MAG TPA: hypothetical protein PK347_10090 [Burkholderiaceae bacterium]|nr:hypothetical protein [Burkholderiaceae bacterium]